MPLSLFLSRCGSILAVCIVHIVPPTVYTLKICLHFILNALHVHARSQFYALACKINFRHTTPGYTQRKQNILNAHRPIVRCVANLNYALHAYNCILLFNVWHGWMRLPLASDSKQWQKCKSFRLTSSSSTSLVRIINRPGAIRMPFPLHKIKYTRVYAVCVCLCIMHSSIAITFSFSI